jgi:hypothetical protein
MILLAYLINEQNINKKKGKFSFSFESLFKGFETPFSMYLKNQLTSADSKTT